MQNHGDMPQQQQPDDPPWETTLLGTDQRRTVLHKRAAQDQADWVYTPYGHNQDTGGLTGGLGFNGERRESMTGHYLLGAGYRAFNPVLMRFNSPDNLSPLGEGGLNPYAYCLGDPVNRIDPSGHLSWQSSLGLGLGLLGIVGGLFSAGASTPLAVAGLATGLISEGTAVASALTENRAPKWSEGLMWASAGLGLAAAGLAGLSFLNNYKISRRILNRGLGQQHGSVLGHGMFTERDITAHGYPFTTATTKPSSGLSLARQLQNVEWKTEAPVRLISCFSANGGSYASQAQVLANRFQRDVTGYYGLVTANRASDTVRGTYRVFSPQNGVTAIRTGVMNTTLSYLVRPAYFLKRPAYFF
jgi:RHS repeat-associated protein